MPNSQLSSSVVSQRMTKRRHQCVSGAVLVDQFVLNQVTIDSDASFVEPYVFGSSESICSDLDEFTVEGISLSVWVIFECSL